MQQLFLYNLSVSLQTMNPTQGFLISKKLKERSEEQSSRLFWQKKPINFGDIYPLYFIEINNYFKENVGVGYQLTNPKFVEIKNGRKKSYKCYQSVNFAGFDKKVKLFHFLNVESECMMRLKSEEFTIVENSLLFVPVSEVDNNVQFMYDQKNYDMVSFDLIF